MTDDIFHLNEEFHRLTGYHDRDIQQAILIVWRHIAIVISTTHHTSHCLWLAIEIDIHNGSHQQRRRLQDRVSSTIISEGCLIISRQVTQIQTSHREVVVDDVITRLQQHACIETILAARKYIQVIISIQIARTYLIRIVQHQAVRCIQRAPIQTVH